MQKAMLAAEDQDFYQNNGISPTGIARAVWVAVKGGQATQGGSTITQQYVKNYFLTAGPHPVAQGPRDPHLGQDRPAADQGRDPRELPQHDLLRPGRLRHPDGVQGVLQQGRLQADPRRERLPRRPSSAARRCTTPAWARSSRPTREERSGFILDAMVEKGWLSQAERAEATFPKIRKYKPRKQCGPDRLHHRDGQERARCASTRSPRPTSTAVACASSRRSSARSSAAMADAVKDERPEADDVHVGMASIKPGDGGDRRAVRRRGLLQAPAERGDPGQDAGRLDVQDLHAHRGAAVR